MSECKLATGSHCMRVFDYRGQTAAILMLIAPGPSTKDR